MKSTVLTVICSLFAGYFSFGQQASHVFKLKQLPQAGDTVITGWLYQAGDDTSWKKPGFDDSKWESFHFEKQDISSFIKTHPVHIGWFRLRFSGFFFTLTIHKMFNNNKHIVLRILLIYTFLLYITTLVVNNHELMRLLFLSTNLYMIEGFRVGWVHRKKNVLISRLVMIGTLGYLVFSLVGAQFLGQQKLEFGAYFFSATTAITSVLMSIAIARQFADTRAKDKSFNAKLHTELDPALKKIQVVPQDLGRVLLNLINNALSAVDEKRKKVKIGYEPCVDIRSKNDGDRIQIIVGDNGTGITDEVKEKIFQPFFTTKDTGQGTGLGLSLSYDIIKAHGGKITVTSKPGEGSEFRILLPVTTSGKS